MSKVKHKCPVCGREGKPEGQLFRCKMHGLYDDNPNEGGTHHSDPSRRMRVQESDQETERANAKVREHAKKGFRFR